MSFEPAVQPPSEPASRAPLWFVVGKRGLLARKTGDVSTTAWALPTAAELVALGLSTDDAHYLGRLDGADAYACPLPDGPPLPDGWSVLGIRGLVDAFDDETFWIAGRATHVLDWASTHRFCGRCGAETERVRKERSMRCPRCAHTMYPRISPAVIVLVRKGAQALLARNAKFPMPFFSTLAGFSDIGETLEDTIRREVFEEVGVRVRTPTYFGSQPWPFPNSLMIGFTAEWESGEIKVDQDEIAEARWFSAGELPMIPPRASIARRLIDAWVEEVGGGH